MASGFSLDHNGRDASFVTCLTDFPAPLGDTRVSFCKEPGGLFPQRARIRAMYTQHFGLEKQPFSAVAQGHAVFVGARQAEALGNLKIALAMADAIAVVSGPVGVGKTTLVGRVLELVAAKQATARVGRTPMTVDEMLEHLLAEFGISGSGTGRMERLRTLRNYFKDCGATGVRAFILVEDARALDIKLLAELEAVTAAAADGSPGANVILMGPAAVTDLIDAAELEHLRQRTRLRQQLEPLNADEIAAYVKHHLEMAGGDFKAIVDPQTPITLRHCTGGIPRIVNNLCETSLTMAAANGVPKLMPHMVQRVAVTIYGIQPQPDDDPISQVVPEEDIAPPAPAPSIAIAKPSAPPTTALMDDPEPTIVEDDLSEEMLKAADALAGFAPHPVEVTQKIAELPNADTDVPEPTAAQPAVAEATAAEQPAAEWTAQQQDAALADTDDPANETMIDADWAFDAGDLEVAADPVPAAEPQSMLSVGETTPQKPQPGLHKDEAPSMEDAGAFHGHRADPEPETAAVVLTESTRIQTLSVLDELADLETAPAASQGRQMNKPPERAEAARPGKIDWSTWPLSNEDDKLTRAPEQAGAAQAPRTPPPMLEPPTLTDVQPDKPMAAVPPPETQTQAQPTPPVLTEVFQVTPRQPAESGIPSSPEPIAHTASATAPGQQPEAAVEADPDIQAPESSELDFSVLLSSPEADVEIGATGQPGSDVPALIDPPAPKPVAGEPQDPASPFAQVTNLAELDELLAETLFGEAELEQLSAEIQAKQQAAQETNAVPAASPGKAPPLPIGTDTTKIERMAILEAMKGLGSKDNDESEQENALG